MSRKSGDVVTISATCGTCYNKRDVKATYVAIMVYKGLMCDYFRIDEPCPNCGSNHDGVLSSIEDSPYNQQVLIGRMK